MRILISACLLGCACRYDGKSKPCKEVSALEGEHELVPFCPEIYGGLATPREPSEIVNGKVLSRDGRDVSYEYMYGAKEALEICKRLGCTVAVLKAKSPSCGKGEIYDGTFSKKLTKGNGITAELLIKNGITVYSEDEICVLVAQNGI